MSVSTNAIIAVCILLSTLVLTLALAWRLAKIRSLEDFNHWAGGVQNLVLTIALFVGGAWALGVFVILQQAPKAAVDLGDLLSRQRAMEIVFDIAEYRGIKTKERDVVITMVFHNAGSRPLELSCAKALVCIRPAGPRCAQTDFVPFMTLEGGNEVSETMLIDPGATKRIPVHWRTSTPGLYFYKFYSPVPEHLQGSGHARLGAYLGMCYFDVK